MMKTLSALVGLTGEGEATRPQASAQKKTQQKRGTRKDTLKKRKSSMQKTQIGKTKSTKEKKGEFGRKPLLKEGKKGPGQIGRKTELICFTLFSGWKRRNKGPRSDQLALPGQELERLKGTYRAKPVLGEETGKRPTSGE